MRNGGETLSFKDADRFELVKAQQIAKTEGKMRVSIRAYGKEYTYASLENPKGRLELWLITHGS